MQKKIFIPIIAIVLLLGALLGVMMMDDASSPNGGDSLSDASPVAEFPAEIKGNILELDTDSITMLDVVSGGKDFSFVNDGKKWSFASNLAVSISSGAVDGLVNSLSAIGYTESYSGMKLSDCGISDSSDAITIHLNSKTLSIRRGINTTDGKYSYMASSENDTVYLVPMDMAEKLFAPLERYRNSAMLKLDFDNISEIIISNANALISLKKGKASSNDAVYNEWKLLSPVETGANDEYIQSKITDPLKQIKIEGFASDNADFVSFGFGTKDNYISLTDKNGKTEKLYFSSQTGGKYYIAVNNEPTIYEIALSNAPYIEMKAIDVADRNINLVKMANISNVTIKGANMEYKVEFLDKEGRINGAEVSNEYMNQKIFPAVCGLFADDINSKAHGTAELVIEYNYNDKSKDRLEFSSYNDRMYSVSKNGKAMYLILKTKISDLAAILDQYKQK